MCTRCGGRCDLRNILGVVTHVNHDNKTYKIGTQFGRINSSYACNQFTTCKEKLMQLENVPDMELSLRKCASKLSLSGGQGYKRCSCKTQCSSNRCTCRKSGKICNSKCHGSLSCSNKELCKLLLCFYFETPVYIMNVMLFCSYHFL